MADKQTLYILELKIPDEDSQRIQVQGRITVGSSSEADICLEDYGLAPIHCNFRDSNEILTVQNTGGDGAVKVGKQELAHGKMYIIDKGDVIKVGDISFVVRAEEVEIQYVDEDGKTLAGASIEEDTDGDTDTDIDTEEDQGKTKSILAKITGLFGRGKSNSDEDEDGDDSQSDGPVFDIIDHSDSEEDENPNESAAPRMMKASGAALGSIKPKKVRVSPYIKKRRAGFIIRLLGLLINLTLVYCIYLYAVPLLNIETYFQKLFEFLAIHIEKILPMIEPHLPANILKTATSFTAIKILAVYIALELSANLILGANLGLFILGATGSGGFIVKRIKALVRTLVGFITTPLLIFDAPILIKARTLKEVLSFSQIEKRSNALSFVLGLTITPVVVLGAFLWPLINDPILLKSPEFEVATQEVRKSKKKENFVAVSRFFDMKMAFFKKDTIEFVPSLEKTGVKLYAIDLKKIATVQISLAKELDLNPAFKAMIDANPFFPSFSPELYAFMAEEKDSKLVTSELAIMVRDAMGITPLRLHEIILEHGPYINGLMNIRLIILNSLGVSNKFKVTSYKAGRKDYLLLEEETTSPLQSTYILPLGAMKLSPIKVQFKGRDRVFANTLVENFFKRGSKLPKSFEFDPSLVQEWNAFSIIDYYSYANLENVDEKVASSIVSFYERQVAILKTPEGLSAKVKDSFAKILRDSLRKTKAQVKAKELAVKLAEIENQLPEVKVIK